eukprot:COSAG01_NODE_24277_length_784_cov_1.433577_2_plen_70_part_00
MKADKSVLAVEPAQHEHGSKNMEADKSVLAVEPAQHKHGSTSEPEANGIAPSVATDSDGRAESSGDGWS